MKKLLLALLLLPLTAAAQTKEETQAWILSKVPYVSYLNYTIDGENLIATFPPMRGGGNTIKRTLALKGIKNISYTHTDKYLSFVLKCDTECAYLIETDGSDKFVSESKKDMMLFELYGKVDADIGPRMEKALLRLVELNGGKAKAVPYQKKKEAF